MRTQIFRLVTLALALVLALDSTTTSSRKLLEAF